MNRYRFTFSIVVLVALALGSTSVVRAQVGSGLLDVNTASAEQLAGLPHMTAAIAKGIVDKRPFGDIVELNASLLASGLTAEQAGEIYAKAFIHVNLNTAGKEAFTLIPGVGGRMAHEFDEYRPWRTWAQFDREIGKYVDKAEVERLKQYAFIPLDLNTASDADFQTIPGVGRRMAHEFEEYRPWRTKEQFEREIGKYVDKAEVARLWRYVVIPADGGS